MSDPVLDIESEETFQVEELITIAYGAKTLYLTFGTNDIEFGGNLYVATSGRRGENAVPQIGDNETPLELTLPIDHPFVRRYLQMLVPPLKTTVTVTRLYEDDSTETAFVGEITSMSVDDENTEATFRVPIRSSEAAERSLPVLSVGRACPYMLYGPGCLVSRTGNKDGLAFKVSTTVIAVNGRDVRVDLASTDRNDGWARRGELVVTSGTADEERMTITGQTDMNPGSTGIAVLTLRQPIPGLKIGDSVDVFAGCDQTIDGDHGCGPKFDNKDNFGGYNTLPDDDPFRWFHPFRRRGG